MHETRRIAVDIRQAAGAVDKASQPRPVAVSPVSFDLHQCGSAVLSCALFMAVAAKLFAIVLLTATLAAPVLAFEVLQNPNLTPGWADADPPAGTRSLAAHCHMRCAIKS